MGPQPRAPGPSTSPPVFAAPPGTWDVAQSPDPGPCLADVNECSSSPCSQECANVYGSYQCYCRRGYQLSDVDGVTCEGEGACSFRPAGGWFFPLREIYPGALTHLE